MHVSMPAIDSFIIVDRHGSIENGNRLLLESHRNDVIDALSMAEGLFKFRSVVILGSCRLILASTSAMKCPVPTSPLFKLEVALDNRFDFYLHSIPPPLDLL